MVRGRRRIRVAFINDYYKPKDPDPKLKGDRNASVHAVEVIGPLEVKPEDLPRSPCERQREIPQPAEKIQYPVFLVGREPLNR